MEITYFKKTGEYRRNDEWDGDIGHKFTFEPDQEEFKKELKKLVVNEYGELAWKMVDDFGLYEEVGAGYKDELKEIFENVAQKTESN